MMHIVLIDDELDLAEVTKAFLELGGQMQVSVAGSALEGLEQLKCHDFDAVVSDYQMPRMDGLQLLKRLRQEGNSIPFILFTGKGREEVVIEALNSGADFYLQKGGQPEAQFAELAHKIRQAVHSRRSESALKQSEQRFKNLFESMGSAVAIYEVRGDGRHGSDYIVKDFNRKAMEIEGKSRDEVVGKSLLELRPRIDEYGLIPIFRQVWETGNEAFYPAKVYIDDHYFNWYQNTIFRLPSDEIVAIYEDVTEQMRSEEALRDSEVRYRSLVEASPDGIVLATLEGKLLMVNPRVAEMFHYADPKDIIGLAFFDLFDPTERDRVGAEFFQLDENALRSEREYLLRRRDGTALRGVMRASLLPDAAGNPVAILGILHDVTERRRSEEALRQSETRYRDLVENSFEGVWIMDGNKITTYVNQRMAEMLHLRPEDMVGRSVTEFLSQGQLEGHEERMSLREAGVKGRYEHCFHLVDGSQVHCMVSSVPNMGPDGRFQGSVGVFMDISEMRRADAAIRERQMKLDSLFKAAPVGMGFVKDRIYLEVNRRTEEMTGYSAAELVGQSTRLLYESDEEYERVGREKYGELDRSGIGTTATRWRRKDGTLLAIQLTSAAIVPGDRSKGVCFIALEPPPARR